MDIITASKFLSLILRHKPGRIGLTLDSNGWADIEELLRLASSKNIPLTRAILEEVVATNDKKRFAVSPDGSKIRANQGHSVQVDLGLAPQRPPEVLFHGTASRFIDSIRERGLLKGKRQHVHLSPDEATALKVGMRHGRPVVIKVAAGRMHEAGHIFYQSENGVWLVNHVPASYLEIGA